MRLILLFLVPPSIAACATPFPPYELTSEIENTLSRRFPHHADGTRMTLRAILEYQGMELPMTLRIWRMLPSSCRIIVTDDLGGTLLHVVDHESAFTILRRAPALPEEFVRSLCRDLRAWMFLRPHPDDRMVSLEDGTPALLQSSDRILGTHTLFRATEPGQPIDRITLGCNGLLTSRIKLEWDGGRPRNIEIENHRSGYTVDLEVREWQPTELTPAKFKTKR